jgi:hypothetical protein
MSDWRPARKEEFHWQARGLGWNQDPLGPPFCGLSSLSAERLATVSREARECALCREARDRATWGLAANQTGVREIRYTSGGCSWATANAPDQFECSLVMVKAHGEVHGRSGNERNAHLRISLQRVLARLSRKPQWVAGRQVDHHPSAVAPQGFYGVWRPFDHHPL